MQCSVTTSLLKIQHTATIRSWIIQKMYHTAMTTKMNWGLMTAMKMKMRRKVASAVFVSQSYSQERKNSLIKSCSCFVISETFQHDWHCISIKANSFVQLKKKLSLRVIHCIWWSSLQENCPHHQAKRRMRIFTGSCARNLNARTGTTKSALQIYSAKESKSPTERSGFVPFNINIHILNSLTCIWYIQCLKIYLLFYSLII